MKKSFLFAISAFMFFTMLSFGQVGINQSSNAPILDSRAKSYYSEEELKEFDQIKIKQINFLYDQSFTIQKIDKICPNCPDLQHTFDISKYAEKRDYEKAIVIDAEYGYLIKLLPWKDVMEAYKKIAEQK